VFVTGMSEKQQMVEDCGRADDYLASHLMQMSCKAAAVAERILTTQEQWWRPMNMQNSRRFRSAGLP